MKLSEKLVDPYTRVLIFGLPGSGKSTLAADLAKTHNLIWITLDNDVDILRKLDKESQDRINLVDIPDSASFPVAAATLLPLFKNKKAVICWEHGVIQCAVCKKKAPTEFTSVDFTSLTSKDIVVVDTVTQLGRSILAHATKDKPIEYRPERDDWGAVRKWTEFFASEFQASRFNLICISQAIEAELEDGRVKLVPDFGSRGMSAGFAKSFSHVIFTETLNKKHKAYSSSTHANNVLTKSRTDFRIEDKNVASLASLFPIDTTIPVQEEVQSKDEIASKEPETTKESFSYSTQDIPSPAENAASSLKLRLAALKGK